MMGYHSDPISIKRCTQRGCPLSLLLFAIAIETVAIAIREDSNIQGVQCGPHMHKCALFADDMLLFVTSPITSLPNILWTLHDFGKVSGLRVNKTKSFAMKNNIPDSLLSRLRGLNTCSQNDPPA